LPHPIAVTILAQKRRSTPPPPHRYFAVLAGENGKYLPKCISSSALAFNLVLVNLELGS